MTALEMLRDIVAARERQYARAVRVARNPSDNGDVDEAIVQWRMAQLALDRAQQNAPADDCRGASEESSGSTDLS